MSNPVALLHNVIDGDKRYPALWFWCPGCETVDEEGKRRGGLHSLPVNTDVTSPSWAWDGDLERPTISPSILTRINWPEKEFVCHSFLRSGVFEFLSDCTHQYANQNIPIPPLPDWVLPDWVLEERNERD